MNAVMSIAFSDSSTANVSTSIVFDYVPVTLHHDKSGEPSVTVDETKSNWKSTASVGVSLKVLAIEPIGSSDTPKSQMLICPLELEGVGRLDICGVAEKGRTHVGKPLQ